MIEVQHLTKSYGNQIAVEDLSFTIPNGQIYGLLGPNGAGKSTTMNILTGCLAATEGEVHIDGYDIFEDAEKAKSRIGYLPEQPPLYLDCTPREYLTFVARAKKVPEREISMHILDVMEKTGVEDVADRLMKNLSKGYKQRVGIAQALVGDPEIIILDEPTSGLDPQQIIEIRDLIRNLGTDHTVILSSHILSEIQRHCSRAAVIREGKIIACDSVEKLAESSARRVTLRGNVKREDLPKCRDWKELGDAVSFLYGGDINVLIRTLAKADVQDMTIAEPDLEEIVLHFYEKGGEQA